MDWSKAHTPPERRPDPPAPELLEVCWRMRAPSGRVLMCGVYRHVAGFEARMGYSQEQLLASSFARDGSRGRAAGRSSSMRACEPIRDSLTSLTSPPSSTPLSVRETTKLRWFDAGAAAFEKVFPGESERHFHRPGSMYVCPLCDRGFNRAAVKARLLTAEHVPPRSFGGRELLLTCAACNHRSGAHIDSQAHLKEGLIDAVRGTPGEPLSVKIERDGTVVNAQLQVGEGRVTTLTVGSNNAPWAAEAFKAVGPPVEGSPPFRIKFFGNQYYDQPAKVSWLRSAYLALFAVAGYRFAFDPALRIVKEQIRNPREKLIPVFTMTLPERLPWSQRRLLQSLEPRFEGAQIGRYIILFPPPGDLEFYGRIEQRKAAAASETFNIHPIDWPTRPTFGYVAPK